MSGVFAVRVVYEKRGVSRFISSRNLTAVIERALRRLAFPFRFTEGHHPRPRISFGPALPVGFSGAAEFFTVQADMPVDAGSLPASADPLLPPGLRFVTASTAPVGGEAAEPGELRARYRVEKNPRLDRAALARVAAVVAEDDEAVTVEGLLADIRHADLKAAAGGGAIERTLLP